MKYVIKINDKFIGKSFEGYHISESISEAYFFDNIDKAVEFCERNLNLNKKDKFSNTNELYPTYLLCAACGLNFQKTSANVTITIQKVELQTVKVICNNELVQIEKIRND